MARSRFCRACSPSTSGWRPACPLLPPVLFFRGVLALLVLLSHPQPASCRLLAYAAVKMTESKCGWCSLHHVSSHRLSHVQVRCSGFSPPTRRPILPAVCCPSWPPCVSHPYPGVLWAGDVPVPSLPGGGTVHERGAEAAVDERRGGARLLPHGARWQVRQGTCNATYFRMRGGSFLGGRRF